MSMVRLYHPGLERESEFPASAAVQMAMSGWLLAEGQALPTCEACGQVIPAFAGQLPEAEPENKTDEAPAESGASASTEQSQPRRRRSGKTEESDQ